MTYRALLIPLEGPITELHIPTDDDGASLAALQAAVGGWIEAVSLPPFVTDADRATAYVNEEGKLEGLPPNYLATDVMVPGVGLMWGDYIAGPMVVCGFDMHTGDNADIPPGVERRVRQIAHEAGRPVSPHPRTM
jgi:hypothetical protein